MRVFSHVKLYISLVTQTFIHAVINALLISQKGLTARIYKEIKVLKTKSSF